MASRETAQFEEPAGDVRMRDVSVVAPLEQGPLTGSTEEATGGEANMGSPDQETEIPLPTAAWMVRSASAARFALETMQKRGHATGWSVAEDGRYIPPHVSVNTAAPSNVATSSNNTRE